MGKITAVASLQNPNFIKPIEIHYTQNGKEKRWEAVLSHDSVAILLYHTQKNAFVLVKQLRVTVLNKNKNNGYMYELCAGIVDKKCSLEQIAKEEILEECGYDVAVQNLEKISAFYTSVGISGTYQTLYYAEIDESMKVSEGGGLEEEEIEVITIPLSEAKKFMFDESYQKTTGVSLSFYWFFDTKTSRHYSTGSKKTEPRLQSGLRVARKLQQPALKYRFQNKNGTQTLVWAESGKKAATAGTQVPVPRKRNPDFSLG